MKNIIASNETKKIFDIKLGYRFSEEVVSEFISKETLEENLKKTLLFAANKLNKVPAHLNVSVSEDTIFSNHDLRLSSFKAEVEFSKEEDILFQEQVEPELIKNSILPFFEKLDKYNLINGPAIIEVTTKK